MEQPPDIARHEVWANGAAEGCDFCRECEAKIPRSVDYWFYSCDNLNEPLRGGDLRYYNICVQCMESGRHDRILCRLAGT